MSDHDIPEVDVATAAAGGESVALVDVRELDEWQAGRAPGAVHVALSSFTGDRLPAATVFHLICRSGARSGKVTEAMRRAGYEAYNVAGGMQAWAAAGLAMRADDGGPGRVI